MGRKRQSTAGDFVDLVALLPWWAGLGLAVVSYVLLHRFAVVPTFTGAPPPDLMTRTVVSGLAMAGQYAVPLLCGVAALMSFVRRRKRAGLVDRATGSSAASAVAGMSWQDFELLVGEAFRLQGFSVAERGGGGADGGVDLVLRRGRETFLVQCKHWRAFKVDVSVVRELYGVMAAEGAAGGFVVTGGEFTADAKAFAEGRNLKLVDGRRLDGLLRQAKAARAGKPASEPPKAAAPQPATPQPAATSQASAAPACPACQSPMVRRTARKGQNAGSQFWGCTRYPACRGTR